ncbi:hypothetical protein B0H17DRAFT_1138554 [Mycena rosella]|uniref:Uncharacterized protein n=1 Tax=Mycena rosella TaxID=1033263 RepID=A0AAD7GDF2_MYCRO|nr:hypothetical protein B0H17DRAFT_1138554 [Mycena rosella]
MAPALNQCIHRYIPGCKVLLVRVEKLFSAYANMCCMTKKTRGAFFSDEAKEMAEKLLETVRKGYLSDPPHVCLLDGQGPRRVVGHTSDVGKGKCGDVKFSGKRFRNREYTDGFGSCNAGGQGRGKEGFRLVLVASSTILSRVQRSKCLRYFEPLLSYIGRSKNINTFVLRRKIQLIKRHSANSGDYRNEPKIRQTVIGDIAFEDFNNGWTKSLDPAC